MSAMKQPFPKHSGTYALIMVLTNSQPIRVGKLGEFDFPAGYYNYVGSAFGPGGLAGRLNRHRGLDAQNASGGWRPHWHIDYLRLKAEIVAIWFTNQDTPREHSWASLVSQLPGATMPVPHFGASDCRCQSHLFHFPQPPDLPAFKRSLESVFPVDAPLRSVRYT